MAVTSRPATDLVGRESEMAVLRALWADGGRLVVLGGVAGVGKSRLTLELAREVAARGGRVLTGRCTESGGDVPYRAIADALLGAARSGWVPPASLAAFVPVLARLVPEWGASGGADSSALVLGEGVVRYLSALAERGAATLLVVEDVQWADADTVALIDYVADAVAGLPVIVVTTLREGVAGPGGDLAEKLVSSRRASILHVPPLDRAGVAALARSCLGASDVSSALIDTLAARTDGVPFLVEELLSAAASPDELEHALPMTVFASVQARLASLSEEAAGIVRCASLIGRHFPWQVAAASAGVRDSDAADALRRATNAQLFERDGSGVRFRHALTRDAVLADMLEPELISSSRTVLDELDRFDPALEGELVLAGARLAEWAGDRIRAAELHGAAARRALAHGSLRAAESLARRALDLAGHDDTEAALLLVAVWNQAGNHLEAGRLAASLAARADSGAAVWVAWATASVRAERWDEADRAIASGCSRTTDPATTARLDVLAAQAALGRNDADRAVAIARRAASADDPISRCEALEVIGRVDRLRDLASAEHALTSARVCARQHGLRTWEIRALHELGTIDMYTTLATERLREARDAAESAGAVSMVAVVDLQLSALHGERMELGESLAAALRCQEVSQRFGLSCLPMAIVLEASAHAKSGNRDAMDDAAERARATARDEASVEAGLSGTARASFHLHRDERVAALEAFERSMSATQNGSTAGAPFAGLWALLATGMDVSSAGQRATGFER